MDTAVCYLTLLDGFSRRFEFYTSAFGEVHRAGVNLNCPPNIYGYRCEVGLFPRQQIMPEFGSRCYLLFAETDTKEIYL